MRWFFRIFGLSIWIGVGLFLHYTLPQHDVVRIVATEVNLVTPDRWNRAFYSDNSQTTRDLQFIRSVDANGTSRVYRNEDTGLWPPYFKFDTQDLQTEAGDHVSTKEAPDWVIIRHYGWRSNYFDIFPNALRITPVADPDVRIIPWFNIAVLTLLVLFGSAVYIRWRRFRQRRIEPMLEGIDDGFDAAGESVRGIGRWFGRKS